VVFSPYGAQFRRRDLTVAVEILCHRTIAPPKRVRIAKRVLAFLLCLAALSFAVWFARETLLRGVAELWIVSDEVSPADAVAVFGGGNETRPRAAAEYYQQGLVKKILIPNIRWQEWQALDGGLDRAMLLKLGVPKTAIKIFGTAPSNTFEEAVSLREWAIRNHARSIIVPTEIFPSRRVHWVLNHEFAGTGTQIEVPALEVREYTSANWWKNKDGLAAFTDEVVKYIYYRIRYSVRP
jgi:uncharacterized SAM-binding protein YcdF (DUF218 family)